MSLRARVISCLDVKDSPRCPQPRSGKDTQTRKAAVL
ncbi:imidazole glycerol phosphate synthase subunit HisF [Rhizobium petrolearium]|nr:imidazole glycerol phosphate synthase subunit HisF [Neorhizobium petrolearium]